MTPHPRDLPQGSYLHSLVTVPQRQCIRLVNPPHPLLCRHSPFPGPAANRCAKFERLILPSPPFLLVKSCPRSSKTQSFQQQRRLSTAGQHPGSFCRELRSAGCGTPASGAAGSLYVRLMCRCSACSLPGAGTGCMCPKPPGKGILPGCSPQALFQLRAGLSAQPGSSAGEQKCSHPPRRAQWPGPLPRGHAELQLPSHSPREQPNTQLPGLGAPHMAGLGQAIR